MQMIPSTATAWGASRAALKALLRRTELSSPLVSLVKDRIERLHCCSTLRRSTHKRELRAGSSIILTSINLVIFFSHSGISPVFLHNEMKACAPAIDLLPSFIFL